jgi:hypothetical protein
MSDIINDIDGIKHIEKMYENLSYFDQYGGSVINFILITIIVFLICSYCYVMINAKEIRDNWQTEKCKPQIMPFAGFINAPEGTSWLDYTSQNFQQCLNAIQSTVAGDALAPITFVTTLMSNMVKDISAAINSVRAMFNKIRTAFENTTKEIMGRLMNIMIPLQRIIIALKDFLGKCQGVMTAGLYTALGSFYALQSLMGAIAQFIIIILIALAAITMALWAVPFTWGAAGAMTAVFLSISIPMVIILAFMLKYLKVKPSLKIPKIKCFDKNTELLLDDGSTKKIIDITVGDKLFNNNEVTATIKVTSENSVMYNLNGVLVSDSHIVKYNNDWIHVSEHPNSILVNDYTEDVLYCLNTNTKIIEINNTVFADWDDLYSDNLTEFINKNKLQSNSHIHKYLDGGFSPNTIICLDNGKNKCIKDISIGELLQNNVKVYGIVELDGTSLNKQYQFNLGNGTVIEGGGNLNIYDDSKKDLISCLDSKRENKNLLANKYNKLYHLLTTENIFWVNNSKFFDYNTCIDLFLDTHRRKLLSMKYV